VNAPNADWRKRPKDRPFFAFINLPRTHESYIWPESTTSQDPLARRVAERNRTELAGKPRLTDPARVTVPPYLPDTPLVRADLARLYDNIAYEERKVGEILAALRQDGLLDRTVVIVSADHGDGLPRMKRAIHDAGLRVPLLVRLPEAKGGGTVRPQLVSFVDLAPTILSLARAPAQGWMHGRPFLGSAKRPNKLVFAAADRFDETQERQRTVIDGRYQYIRNYRPDLPQLQRLAFRDQLPTMQEIWRLRAGGALPPLVAQYVAAPKAAEELYDLRADPHTVRNLAADPAAAAHLRRLRRDLATWTRAVGDMSEAPEAEMVARMWPGLVQPRTAPVTISSGRPRRPQTVTLSSATTGASIGYRFKGEAGWRLYTTPFEGPTGAVVEAKAIRYGYAESPLAQFAIP